MMKNIFETASFLVSHPTNHQYRFPTYIALSVNGHLEPTSRPPTKDNVRFTLSRSAPDLVPERKVERLC